MGLIFSQCDAKEGMCITFQSPCTRKLFDSHFHFLLPTAWEGVATRALVQDLDIRAMCRARQKQTTSLVLLTSALLYVRQINFYLI